MAQDKHSAGTLVLTLSLCLYQVICELSFCKLFGFNVFPLSRHFKEFGGYMPHFLLFINIFVTLNSNETHCITLTIFYDTGDAGDVI
jgi:hypothetical protein